MVLVALLEDQDQDQDQNLWVVLAALGCSAVKKRAAWPGVVVIAVAADDELVERLEQLERQLAVVGASVVVAQAAVAYEEVCLVPSVGFQPSYPAFEVLLKWRGSCRSETSSRSAVAVGEQVAVAGVGIVGVAVGHSGSQVQDL